MKKRFVGILLIFMTLGGVIGGCGATNADKANKNLGELCERFECQRRIIAINAITDKPILDVEGRCSIEKNGALSAQQDTLELICKMGPNDYRKHFIGLADNVTWSEYQMKGLKVSEYRTKFVIRPESVVPDLDLVTGDQP